MTQALPTSESAQTISSRYIVELRIERSAEWQAGEVEETFPSGL